ncbi:DUF4231 domain-containing protein [Kribbella catacumbae]|uniref:DUF4231 domain-containing protein n=1 Tax=Kribbella catacumbae TaxID=460086 RepID=UPI00037A7630|nr:DUF4231 domain-containing protein [Kribbella catacumbae]
MSVTEFVNDLWRQQSMWSLTADRMKRQIARARALSLAVTVAAATLGALAGLLADPAPTASRVLVALAAFGVAAIPLLRPGWSGRKLRDWTRARSVAEALKSEIHLWLARAGQYQDDDQAVRLREKVSKVRSDGADLLRYQTGITPAERELPPIHDLTSYFEVRVTRQIKGYYRLKATRLQSVLRSFRTAEIALAMVGALLGATAAVVGGSRLIPWIAVITTITAAIAVHVAATRYEFQLIEFLRTADRLDQLQSESVSASAERLSLLAIAAEDVISIENEGWMAKLAEDPPMPQ